MSRGVRASRPLSRSRRWAFRLVALGLVALFLLAVEGVARLVPPPADPYVDLSSFTLFRRLEVDGVPTLEISHPFAYPERHTRFPAAKPAGGYRVFVVGASAAAGWPHPPEETATAYLQIALAAAAGGRPVEVINASAHGFPSYRVRRVFEEILDYEPDAVVVWTGNNEFLETRSYAARRASRLGEALVRRSRAAALLRDAITPRRTHLEGDRLNELAATFWKKAQQEALELRDDPEQFAGVREHYAASVRAMAREGRRRGVRVVLATVPVNLRDWRPSASVHAATGGDLASWEEAYRTGRAALLLGKASPAAAALERAAELDPEHAETRFWLGRAREAAGDREAARKAYEAARDLDRNPFRAHGAFNAAVRTIAREEGADLLDLESLFARAAPSGTPGFDLFLDYVHPTVRGNRLVSRALYEGFAPDVASGAAPAFAALRDRLVSGYRDADDLALQTKIFGMSAINHQYEAALARAARAVSLAKGRPGADLPAAVPEALRLFPRLLAAERAEILGEPTPPAAQGVAEELDAFYERWFGPGMF